MYIYRIYVSDSFELKKKILNDKIDHLFTVGAYNKKYLFVNMSVCQNIGVGGLNITCLCLYKGGHSWRDANK